MERNRSSADLILARVLGIFVGDIGSLALGGLAVLSKNEIASAIIHGVFLAAALSVMIQVASFKMTGRRVLKMATVHRTA